MSRNPHTAWIKTDPIALVFQEHFDRTPWRKGDFPTTVSRDGKFIYLASMDTSVPTDDPEYLLRMFHDVYERFKSELQMSNWSCRRAALIETDYLALWDILRDLDALPEDYLFPEYYLELAWRGYVQVACFSRDVPDEAIA